MVENGTTTTTIKDTTNSSHLNNNHHNTITNENSEDASSPSTSPSILPNNCCPLTHQVAGHFYGKGRTKLGLLQTNDGLVLKPVQSPPRGEREHNFFKHIFQADNNELNEDEIKLKNFLPTYRGSFIHNEIIYIKMDDIAYGIKYPAVIDFKMGRITYDPEASLEKITRQRLKYPPVEKIGFQLLGMRVFNRKEAAFKHYDKIFGRNLSEDELVHGLALYYQFHETTPQIRAIKETIRKFEEIKQWFLKQKSYHFYSSSLIVIYDAFLQDSLENGHSATNGGEDNSPSNNNNNNNNDNFNQNNLFRVIMADFAHVFPANNTLDTNYLYGLERLIEHLSLLIKPDYQFKDVRVGK